MWPATVEKIIWNPHADVLTSWFGTNTKIKMRHLQNFVGFKLMKLDIYIIFYVRTWNYIKKIASTRHVTLTIALFSLIVGQFVDDV